MVEEESGNRVGGLVVGDLLGEPVGFFTTSFPIARSQTISSIEPLCLARPGIVNHSAPKHLDFVAGNDASIAVILSISIRLLKPRL